MDAVVGDGDSDVSVFMGNGDGTFGPPTSYSTAAHVYDLAVGDFDVDGHDDIAACCSGTDRIYILCGDGSGGFTLHSSYDVVDCGGGSLVVADFDLNGADDVAIYSSSAPLRVLLNAGSGTPVHGSFSAAATAPGTVLLEWRVEALAGIRGFHVYRATSPDGPFARLTGDPLVADSHGSYEDATVWPETTFWYELRAVLTGGAEDAVGVRAVSATTPGRLLTALHLLGPNPFRSTTRLAFDVPDHAGAVSLAIYDVSGKLVRSLVRGEVERGRHPVVWDGKDDRGARVSSGVYFTRLVLGGDVRTAKLVVVR